MAPLRRIGGLLSLLLVVACTDTRTEDVEPSPPAPTPTADLGFSVERISYDQVPDWSSTNPGPAYAAFQESCAKWVNLPDDRPLSLRTELGGLLADWRGACDAADVSRDGPEARAFFEDWFHPYEVATDIEDTRLTGYFEPRINVSDVPGPERSEPIPAIPRDLITVDLGQFDPGLAGRKVWGKLDGSALTLYPARGDIDPDPESTIAYAHPADVFFLQIQGSGRLVFEDGRELRAAFAAHNHRPYESLGNHLLREGLIERREATMSGIRAWMDRVSMKTAEEAMNVNPRYIFFNAEPINDPEKGPRGAQGVPLTPMGSIAVDLNHYPLGLPIYIEGRIPSDDDGARQTDFRGLAIAQDTGGAIVGIQRADLFFGWGDEAGLRAGSTNSPVKFWILLPKALAQNGNDE